MPNVSIIMPVYNKANYLAKTFNALISQSYQDWEMIVVNDGSTDGSTDIIEKYVTTNFWGNAECIGERCGAWFEGRCRYNGM